MARRRGFGPSGSAKTSTFAPITDRALVGTKRRCGRRRGRITVAGMTKEVTFEPVEGALNDLIDDAYRAKYHGSPYLGSMISARARSATVKVTPSE
jgi:hypothetical protein